MMPLSEIFIAASLLARSFAHRQSPHFYIYIEQNQISRNVLLIVADDAGRQLGYLGDPLV